MAGIEVLKEDESHGGTLRQVSEESGKGLEAAGGSAHTDDGKGFVGGAGFLIRRETRRGTTTPFALPR
jgi:hypothetical protein